MTELPIIKHLDEIYATIFDNPVTIIVGETGSGKTTILPCLLYDEEFDAGGIIGITEPRRIAATSVAKYVASKLNIHLGEDIGYQIRFDDETSRDTTVKFMTEGILLREFQDDPDISKYSVIMVDEAHERNMNIDFMLGLLKDLLKRRKDLKVIISSATIDSEKFSKYFNGAPVIKVSGRTHPVDIIWSKQNYHGSKEMVEAVAETIRKIHDQKGPGDILTFMTGVDDINKTIGEIEKYGLSNVVILPAHGSLSPEDQDKIFQNYPGQRKIIVATNIAETSITIDGVVYVVDSGFIKETHFNPGTGIGSLDMVKHSRAGCDQRAGRAGRTRPGTCYRLYTEEDFNQRPDYTEPEIKRTSIAGLVLQMEAIGLENIEEFDFIDPPDPESFQEAYDTLISLGAIVEGKKGLTKTGESMAALPLDPRISRMVLEAKRFGCVEEVATVAAFLSAGNVFVRPREEQRKADAEHEKFKNPNSDAITFLNVWHGYESSGYDRSWCYDNFLNSKSLFEVRNIRNQLFRILENNGIEVSRSDNDEDVVRSVAAGLIFNLSSRSSRFGYSLTFRRRSFSDPSAFIHPGSSLFKRVNPRWLVATELKRTSKLYMLGCSAVKAEWLPELVPSEFSFSDNIKITDYEEGSEMVSCEREIVTRRGGVRIGWGSSTISVYEATQIQNRLIQKAKENGWVKIKIEKSDSFRSFGRLENGSVVSMGLSGLDSKIGSTYYCSKDSIFGGREKIYHPEFEVFNFGHRPKEEPKRSEEVDDLVSKLSEKFKVTRV